MEVHKTRPPQLPKHEQQSNGISRKLRKTLMCNGGVQSSSAHLDRRCIYDLPLLEFNPSVNCNQTQEFNMTNYKGDRSAGSSKHQEFTFVNASNGTVNSQDSGYLSKSTVISSNSSSKRSVYENSGEIFIAVSLNSRKEIVFKAKALKTNCLRPHTKIAKIRLEINSKPNIKLFQRKIELDALSMSDGVVHIDAGFKSPFPAILDISSLLVTIFYTTKQQTEEIGFVEIAMASLLQNVKFGDKLLKQGWINLYKLSDRSDMSTEETNKENKPVTICSGDCSRNSRRHSLPPLPVTQLDIYEPISNDEAANETSSTDFTFHIARHSDGDFGFTISGTKPSRVCRVISDSPAFMVGLISGDEIVAVNGSNVVDHSSKLIARMIKSTAANDKLRLTVLRKNIHMDEFLVNSRHHCTDQQIPMTQVPINDNNIKICRIDINGNHIPIKLTAPETSYVKMDQSANTSVGTSAKRRVKAWKVRSIRESLNFVGMQTSGKRQLEVIQEAVDESERKYSKWNPDISCIPSDASNYDQETPVMKPEDLFSSSATFSLPDRNKKRRRSEFDRFTGGTDEYKSIRINSILSCDYSSAPESPAEEDNAFLDSHQFDDETYIKPSNSTNHDLTTLNENSTTDFKESVRCLEKDFVNVAQPGLVYYIRQLKSSKLISDEQHTFLFQNYEKMITISQYLLASLSSELMTFDLLSYFNRIEMFCEQFQVYLSGCVKAFELLRDLQQDEDFNNFIEEQKSKHDLVNIDNFLLLPVAHHMKRTYELSASLDSNETIEKLQSVSFQCSETLDQLRRTKLQS